MRVLASCDTTDHNLVLVDLPGSHADGSLYLSPPPCFFRTLTVADSSKGVLLQQQPSIKSRVPRQWRCCESSSTGMFCLRISQYLHYSSLKFNSGFDFKDGCDTQVLLLFFDRLPASKYDLCQGLQSSHLTQLGTNSRVVFHKW